LEGHFITQLILQNAKVKKNIKLGSLLPNLAQEDSASCF